MPSFSAVELIIADIKNCLRERGEYVTEVDDDTPHAGLVVQSFRAWGRRAGRELGWRVRTSLSTTDHSTRIWVVVKESNPVHQASLAREGYQELTRAVNDIFARAFPNGPTL